MEVEKILDLIREETGICLTLGKTEEYIYSTILDAVKTRDVAKLAYSLSKFRTGGTQAQVYAYAFDMGVIAAAQRIIERVHAREPVEGDHTALRRSEWTRLRDTLDRLFGGHSPDEIEREVIRLRQNEAIASVAIAKFNTDDPFALDGRITALQGAAAVPPVAPPWGEVMTVSEKELLTDLGAILEWASADNARMRAKDAAYIVDKLGGWDEARANFDRVSAELDVLEEIMEPAPGQRLSEYVKALKDKLAQQETQRDLGELTADRDAWKEIAMRLSKAVGIKP